ncbi:hypothetical protein HK102_003564 [Quaeritorhiza haematococci]|nr:hypothetical protein HK102_003564 [Quaeritorhiza haematococci]
MYRAWSDLLLQAFSDFKFDVRGRSEDVQGMEVSFGFFLWFLALGPAFVTHLLPMVFAYCWMIIIALIALTIVTTIIWQLTDFGDLLKRSGAYEQVKDPEMVETKSTDDRNSGRSREGLLRSSKSETPLSTGGLWKYAITRIVILVMWEVFIIWVTQAFFVYALHLYQDRTTYISNIYNEFQVRTTVSYFDDVKGDLDKVMKGAWSSLNLPKFIDFLSVVSNVILP